MLTIMHHTSCAHAQEDLDEEECPEGFKLSGAVPEAQPDSEAPQGATASRHPLPASFASNGILYHGNTRQPYANER